MMIITGRYLLALATLAMPVAAFGQASNCRIPQSVPAPKADRAGPARPGAIGGYLLALSWSPQFCRRARRDYQCSGRGGRFGFILHGLWPQGTGPEWPQYCRPVSVLPKPVLAAMSCTTPSVDLVQHEWAKHGSCMTTEPQRYFTKAKAMYDGIRIPDMDRLSRQRLTAAGLATAFARANPGLPDQAVAVSLGKGGWLQEVRLCHGTDFHPRACRVFERGATADQPVKIWRNGGRGTRPYPR
jgi:ribonuclease T2